MSILGCVCSHAVSLCPHMQKREDRDLNKRSGEYQATLNANRQKGYLTLDEARKAFLDATAQETQSVGWDTMFNKYDSDGNAELDPAEFTNMIRLECELSAAMVPELEELFGIVDTDQSGSIDSTELKSMLQADVFGQETMSYDTFFNSCFEMATSWVQKETPEAYVTFLRHVFEIVSIPTNGHPTHQDEDLAKVPVFADAERKTPNFLFRPFSAVVSWELFNNYAKLGQAERQFDDDSDDEDDTENVEAMALKQARLQALAQAAKNATAVHTNRPSTSMTRTPASCSSFHGPNKNQKRREAEAETKEEAAQSVAAKWEAARRQQLAEERDTRQVLSQWEALEADGGSPWGGATQALEGAAAFVASLPPHVHPNPSRYYAAALPTTSRPGSKTREAAGSSLVSLRAAATDSSDSGAESPSGGHHLGFWHTRVVAQPRSVGKQCIGWSFCLFCCHCLGLIAGFCGCDRAWCLCGKKCQ